MIYIQTGSQPSDKVKVGKIGGYDVYIGTSAAEKNSTTLFLQGVRDMSDAEVETMRKRIVNA